MITAYRVDHPLTFNGRKFGVGDPISRDYILEVNPSKLGTLLRTGYISEPPDRPLEDMTMNELRDHARDVGVTGPLPRSKKDLIATIEEGKHSDGS